ncbi:MAG TPA: thiamine pyrophosphate-binding protein, partial [Alphaproteobacteria bacterium]|nr:thiamine pyrophosphate-binding protein [Alphaproteobacteria bacterium]
DELHQERVARLRNRPVENRWVGMRMTDPPFDLAMLARGQGAIGLGPIKSHAELAPALKEAIEHVRAGAVCVVDVRVAAEYARATSVALMRGAPTVR